MFDQSRGYRAIATRLHDADSFWVSADTGFGSRYEPELRLLGVRAPELSQAGGKEAAAFVGDWLLAAEVQAHPVRWYLWVETVLTRVIDPTEKQSFTRYMATVWRLSDCSVWGCGGPPELSLNSQVTAFLSEHPAWPPGD